ncbi:MAG: hypothetical protein E7359_01040 [Clostridiales bacterium]|nr:hypothetical protein [Clostridiales bacterium]
MSEDNKKNTVFMDNLFKLPFLKKIKNIKHIEIYICIIFIGLLLLIYFYGFGGKKANDQLKETASSGEIAFTSSSLYAKELEEKLEQVIGNLKGVGMAKVMVSVKSGGEIVIANSITEETVVSTDGESQNVTIVKTPIIVTENGESKPIILMEILPEIQGVIVVAEGADDTMVKLNIYQAVQAIITVPSVNIQVFAGE